MDGVRDMVIKTVVFVVMDILVYVPNQMIKMIPMIYFYTPSPSFLVYIINNLFENEKNKKIDVSIDVNIN
jgi:hypothetical protein